MRIFNLFLRRAGVRAVPVRVSSPVSRLTVECRRADLPDIRRRICAEFKAAGLHIAALRVDFAPEAHMVRACVTVDCSREQRPALMREARRLGASPGIRGIRWGDHRRAAMN